MYRYELKLENGDVVVCVESKNLIISKKLDQQYTNGTKEFIYCVDENRNSLIIPRKKIVYLKKYTEEVNGSKNQ